MYRFLENILIILIVISSIHGKCSKVFETIVSVDDQKIILDKHNSLRLSLAKGLVKGQPRACNMKRLKYDLKLAAEAQKIANTCEFEHVEVKDSRWAYVGQNLLIFMSSAYKQGADWNSAIQSWFDEHKLYKYPEDSNLKTGHYTQLAWADTQYVGCGFRNYEGNGKTKYQRLYVCNYGPGGNYENVAPYKTIRHGKCDCENLC